MRLVAMLSGAGYIGYVGFTGLAVLVLAWLVVSFTKPSPRRVVIEWVGACGMYVALESLFVYMFRASNSMPGAIAFGFLSIFFSAGLALCVVQLAMSLRGPRDVASSATN